MVNIAVAAGTGNVATELLRAPIASGNHSITILTRSAPKEAQPGIAYKTVDYQSRASLVQALRGADVCLAFLLVHQDTDCVAQKNLIHACIDAGVRRFAPAEWGIKNGSGIAPYANKDVIAHYLAELNSEQQVLEYCLFQPSIFMDYFAHPHPLSPGLITWPFFIDFENRRAMVLDSGDQPIVITAIADVSSVLERALSDPNPWPAVGGMRGARTTINELIALGKKLRGGDWSIEHVKGEDVLRGELRTSWVPQFSHPATPEEHREQFSYDFVLMFLAGILRGSWEVSGEFNARYPDMEFQSAEEYLAKAWAGRP